MIATRKLTLSSAVALAAFGLFVGVGGTAVAAPDAVGEPSVTEAATTDAGTDAPAPVAGDDAGDQTPVANAADSTPVPQRGGGLVKAATYSKLKISPAGPYKGGETVKITGTGFEANEQVVLSICVGGQKLAGPQDCAPLNGSSSAIGAANGSGSATLSIKVIKGKLGAQSKPAHVCGNGASESCVFSLTNFGGGGPAAVRVAYQTAAAPSGGASAGSGADTADTGDTGDTGDTSGAGASTDAGTQTAGGAQLPATGGSVTESAAVAVAFVVLGAFLLLVTRREQQLDG